MYRIYTWYIYTRFPSETCVGEGRKNEVENDTACDIVSHAHDTTFTTFVKYLHVTAVHVDMYSSRPFQTCTRIFGDRRYLEIVWDCY